MIGGLKSLKATSDDVAFRNILCHFLFNLISELLLQMYWKAVAEDIVFHISFYWKCMTWNWTCWPTSNNLTYYLLDYGVLNLLHHYYINWSSVCLIRQREKLQIVFALPNRTVCLKMKRYFCPCLEDLLKNRRKYSGL